MSDLSVFINRTQLCYLINTYHNDIEPVSVMTCDARLIVGILEGFDQAMNLILSHSHERVFSLDEPVAVVQLGLYMLRGDNV